MYTAIIQHFCNQLLQYQAAIATRTDNPGVPTLQDVQVQCKIINCIDKLERLMARQEKQNARLQKGPAPAQTQTAVLPADTDAPDDTKPPISMSEFQQHRAMIGKYNTVVGGTTVRFRGRDVSARWLEYNLFQYYLPQEQRRFIKDIQGMSDINYPQYREKIQAHLKCLVLAA